MRVITLCALFATMACATTRTPATVNAAPTAQFSGDSPLQMTIRGSSYSGSINLKRQGDSASGTFRVVGPGTVHGNVRGRVTGNDVVLDLTYDVIENGCKGTMRLTGVIANAIAQGAAEAQDSCVGRMTGTFRLGRS